jgi:hypothetical protein
MLVASFSAAATDWSLFSQLELKNGQIVVEFAQRSGQIRLRFFDGNAGSRLSSSFEAQDYETLEAAKVEIDAFLTSASLDADERTEVWGSLNEIQLLNPKNCRAIHIELQSIDPANQVSPLLQELDNLHAQIVNDDEAFRSLLLTRLKLNNGDEVQVRVLLNKENEILKLSLVNGNADLKEFEVKAQNGKYYLKSKGGQVLLEIDAQGLEKDGGQLILNRIGKYLNGVEPFFLDLKKGSGSFVVKVFPGPYSLDLDKRTGVILKSSVADHRDVLQLGDTDIFFLPWEKSLWSETGAEVYGELSDENWRKGKDFYNLCMAEKISSHKFKDEDSAIEYDEKEFKRFCIRKALIEFSENDLKEGTQNLKALKTLKNCLVQQEIIEKNDFYTYIKEEKVLSFTPGDFRNRLKKCISQSHDSSVFDLIEKEVFQNSIYAQFVKEEVLLKKIKINALSKVEDECEGTVSQCLDLGKVYLFEGVFLKIISEKYINHRDERKSIIESYQVCQNALKEKIVKEEVIVHGECEKEALVESSTLFVEDQWRKMFDRLDFFTGLQFGLEESEKNEFQEEVKQCFYKALEGEGSFEEFLNRFDEVQHACTWDSFKSIVSALYPEKIKSEYRQFLSSLDKPSLEKLESNLSSYIKNKISTISSIENIDLTLNEIQPHSLGKIIHHYFETSLERYFPVASGNAEDSEDSEDVEDAEDKKENQETQAKIKKLFLEKFSQDGAGSVEVFIKQQFKKTFEKDGAKGIVVLARDFIKELEEISSYHWSYREVAREVLREHDINLLVNGIERELKSCLNGFPANSVVDIDQVILTCKKKRLAALNYALTERRMVFNVSQNFALTTPRANSVLTPLTFLNTCLKEIDPTRSLDYKSFEELSKACIRVTELDISFNIMNARTEAVRPMLLYPDQVSGVMNHCYNFVFKEIEGKAQSGISDKGLLQEGNLKEIVERFRNKSSSFEFSLLEYQNKIRSQEKGIFNPEDYNVQALLQRLSKSKSLSREWWDKKLSACETGTDAVFKHSFREYLIKQIPALKDRGVSDKSLEMLRSVLDFEMIELIFDFTNTFERKESNLVALNPLPENATVTPSLSIEALHNFVLLTSDLLSEGYVYNEKEMNVELFVFKEELRELLKYAKRNPEEFTVSTALEFFNETTIADHLALAIVNKRIKEKIQNYIRKMGKKAVNEFLERKGCEFTSCLDSDALKELRSIIGIFEKMQKVTKNQTKFYDFERILFPNNATKDRLLEAIKKTYLLPKVMGTGVTEHSKRNVDLKIATLIGADQTVGGFVDRFVEVIADYELQHLADERWGITKAIFFDTGDFEWKSLRKTKAGREALNYYARTALIPSIIGQSHVEKSFREEFLRLLDKAQSENDD